MTAAATTDSQRFVQALDRNLTVIKRNVDGIDHERSLLTVVPDGSHLNWLLGHLVASRDGMLRALDAETVWDRETGALYRRGSAAALAPDARPLEDLMAALDRSQSLLESALSAADQAALARESGDRTVGEWLDFLVWHESYHAGQTALYRRLAGLEGALG